MMYRIERNGDTWSVLNDGHVFATGLTREHALAMARRLNTPDPNDEEENDGDAAV